jgi:rhomboid protease GluP
MLVVTCPHCRAAVVPQTNGTCPACRRAIPPALAEPFVIQSGYGVPEGGPPDAACFGGSDPYGGPVTRGESQQQAIARFWHRLLEITPRTLVTPAIVGINAVIFLLMTLDCGSLFSPRGDTLVSWGANFGPLTLDGQWWRLLTCTFVHIGIIHVGLNMWVLWDIGQLVERLTGNVGFLLLYLLSGLFGSLASVYWNPEVLSAGASGAVFGSFGGLMGFALLRGDSIPKSMLGRLRNSGFSFLFYNMIFGFSIKGIDMAAHLGGLAAGFACGLILSQPLDQVTSRTRTWRNGMMLVLGLAGLLIAWRAAPAAPVDLRGRLTQFEAVEQTALDTYNEAVRKFQHDQLSQDEFVRVIETQVLPPWRDVREQFDQIDPQRVAADSQTVVSKLRQYLSLREQAWTAFAAGLKDNDPRRLDEAKQKNEAADQLGREVGVGN